ncbi:MAG: sulfatase-like hydrolase/transferase [Pirellulales bacterium]
MIMRIVTTTSGAAIGLALTMLNLLVPVADAEEASQRPNFVFIYADDWRSDCLGVVQREQGVAARFPWLETPRLDVFAGQSMRFRESFVVNSLCSPGRACVLTGRYSHLNGIIGNGQPLPVNTVSLASRLQDAGYRTAYCGKWHMDGQRERPGFDFVASFVGQGRYFDCPILVRGTDNPVRRGNRRTELSVLQQTPTSGWIDDVSTDYAIEFLEKQSNDEPFFLFLGFKSPHGPRGGNNLPERVRSLYAGNASRTVPNVDVQAVYRRGAEPAPADAPRREERQVEGHRAYMRHITAIDHCVGRLLDALDRTGHAEQTVVIVASDNGYYLGEHGLSDKRSAYEESIRVPLMIRLPGDSARRGDTSHALVLNIDYAPTILDFAGAEPLPGAQGRSLRPLLEAETRADWRTAFFYEYFKEGQYESPTMLAVRTATHKLITYPGHDEWTELFDLENDPYETKNLVDDAGLLAKMRGVFDAEAEAVAFRMPDDVPKKKERPGRREGRKRNRAPRVDLNQPQSGDRQ